MQKYSDVIIGSYAGGAAMPMAGASVKVTTLAGATAVIYSDNSGTVTANPLTSGADGRVSFYAADGRYTLTITATGFNTATVSDILLEDPANGSAVVVVGGSVDNSPIGASTPSTGSFTTLTATGAVTFGGVSTTQYGSASGATYNVNQAIRLDSAANTGFAVGIPQAGNIVGGYYFANSGSYDGGMEYNGTTRALSFKSAGGTAAYIDSNGNFGLGAAPNTWTTKALQLGNNQVALSLGPNGTGVNLTSIARYNSAWQYSGNGSAAARYDCGDAVVGQHTLYSAPSGTAGTAVTWTAVSTVSKDKSLALQGATSGAGCGISFPATQVASSDANTLDDYEEGTWTPVFNGWTNVGVPTVSGRYTKVGDIVYVEATITPATTCAATAGSSYLTGLPFTQANDSICAWANHSTGVGFGNGLASGALYAPSIGATANVITVSAIYRV